MSTFMAYGAVDLGEGVTADEFASALERELATDKDANRPLEFWVSAVAGRVRITLFAIYGNIWLGRVVAQAGRGVAIERAVLGLDHDEYGVEHVVLDGRSGGLMRVHHVYVYPEGEPDEEFAPHLTDLRARPDIVANPDGTLTGSDALAAAAALYGVGAEAMVRAVRDTASAHESLQIVFTPLAPWWPALGLTYPFPDLGDPDRTLNPPGE
jgi:hypothetical protein